MVAIDRSGFKRTFFKIEDISADGADPVKRKN